MPEVSVVIPVYNNADTIEEQLDALNAGLADAPSTEIIVVDNRSADRSAEVVAAWSRRTGTAIRVVPAEARAGEPHARNVGIRAAKGDCVLFCDGDDIVRPDWIRSLHDALKSEKYVTGPVSTELLNEPWLANVRGTAVFEGLPMLHGTVPFAHGCNMGFRRSVLEDIGGFDETFLAGCDQVIAIQAWRAGYELVFVPEAIVDYRLRPDLRSTWKQGRSYGRYRVRVRQLIAEHLDRSALRRANIRRLGWLTKHLPSTSWDRATRARWVWVASQLAGELQGAMEERRGA